MTHTTDFLGERAVFCMCGRCRRRAVPGRHNDDNRGATNVRVFFQAETNAGQSLFLQRNRAGVLEMGGYWDGVAGEKTAGLPASVCA